MKPVINKSIEENMFSAANRISDLYAQGQTHTNSYIEASAKLAELVTKYLGN